MGHAAKIIDPLQRARQYIVDLNDALALFIGQEAPAHRIETGKLRFYRVEVESRQLVLQSNAGRRDDLGYHRQTVARYPVGIFLQWQVLDDDIGHAAISGRIRIFGLDYRVRVLIAAAEIKPELKPVDRSGQGNAANCRTAALDCALKLIRRSVVHQLLAEI